MTDRTAHPYRDLDVIDSRAPRTNQAVIGALALVAFLLDVPWLPALLATQLAVGLTFGRRYCLPCLVYFEVIQPRFGEGSLEDSRPPRFANMVGVAFLGGASLAFLLGVPTLGWVLTLIVSALALLAATTGLCMGCEVYVRLARLFVARRVDRGDLALPVGSGVVAFTSRYCLDCRLWLEALERAGVEAEAIDVATRPDLARRYGIHVTPMVLVVGADGGVRATYDGPPHNATVARVAALA